MLMHAGAAARTLTTSKELPTWRHRTGLSRGEVARRAHIGDGTIGRIEIGAGRAGSLALTRLAARPGIAWDRGEADPAGRLPERPSREDVPS